MLKVPNINLGLIAVIFVLLVVSISVACAHQPRLVIGDNASNDNPIVMQNPEVSQAFYGELQGQSNYYQIKSDNQFKFYLNLLVPASPGIPPDFISAQVLDSSGNVILTLDGTNSTWNSYFEEFGGDYYLKGPETKADLPAGTYYIKIFNTANQGKYSIAIGEEESFPLDETMKALVTIPLLKEQIFGKPVPTLFFEFLGIIIAFGSTLVLFALLLMSRKSKEITQLTVTLNSMVKPVILLGIAITTIVWLYVMYKNPFNIEGIVNTILLVVLIIFNWYVSSKLAKTEFGKLPLISMTVFIILWLIYTYLAIALI